MDQETDEDMVIEQCSKENVNIVSEWMEKLREGTLTSSHFKEYWQKWVPRIYSAPENDTCLSWSFHDDKAQKILFSTLEEFICNGDPASTLSELGKSNRPPTVCGHVFKFGEVIYCCTECGLDNTCVLCLDCFKNSEHRFHRYKIALSDEGGCCDCGDTEAWKRSPFCDIHVVGTHKESHNLPEDLAKRTQIVFDAVLWYAFHLLTLEQPDLRQYDLPGVDTYCVVLYNDEIHTFKEVVNTLKVVFTHNYNIALEHTSNVDSEGRAIISCSTFQRCNKLKVEIEAYNMRKDIKPLEVSIVHAYVIAHQIFALKLLTWLKDFISEGEGFRSVFCQVALKLGESDHSLLQGILLNDPQLWKSARAHWHHLLISGMLLEYENKKALAKVFTENYNSIMNNFIHDDLDHSFCVASLSVQIYTVPSIAHHLIASNGFMSILLNTFISKCFKSLRVDWKQEFERALLDGTLNRARFILHDLDYLLSATPGTWTDELRSGFSKGLSVLLHILFMMEGMCSFKRQVGQHIEYDPEWESAFDLQILLTSCISSTLKWCGSDKIVLIDAYKATLEQLCKSPCNNLNKPSEIKEVAGHKTSCVAYDVLTKHVSFHATLSRFLAGLHVHLDKYGLSFDDPELQGPKPTPEQIIEPALRTQVMIAQARSGMWQRNGESLFNQLYYYNSIRYRTEMFDRDVILLQIGASLIESNDFLIHVLNTFNLLNWASPNFDLGYTNQEDTLKQAISLAEEFLQLIIFIIGERHVPGISKVTNEDKIKKEVTQQLCIKPATPSQLNKRIPDEIINGIDLDGILQELAVFNKPTTESGNGVFELKKEFCDDYNVFFYHYTREQSSESEEAQRKLRKNDGLLECCPPPSLPEFNGIFKNVVNLLQCDVMLHIMTIILERGLTVSPTAFSELQLHRTLHLIGYALQEEQSKRYPFLLFSEKAIKCNIPILLEKLQSNALAETHKDLIKWTLNKFKEIANLSIEAGPSGESRSLGGERERRAKLAAEKRALVMAQMAAMQKSFMQENAKLFEEANNELDTSCDLSEPAMDLSDYTEEQPVALGSKQTTRVYTEKRYTCILCQEDQVVSVNNPSMVLVGFVQQSSVLCQNRDYDLITKEQNPLFLTSNLGPAPHTSTCGHVMHSYCWQKYFKQMTIRGSQSVDADKNEFLCPLCERLSNTVLALVPSLCIIQPSDTPDVRASVSFDEWISSMGIIVRNRDVFCHGTFKCKPNSNSANSCAQCNKLISEAMTSQQDIRKTCKYDCDNLQHRIFNLPRDLNAEFGGNKENFLALFKNNTFKLNISFLEMIHLLTQVIYTEGLSVNRHASDERLQPMAWKSLSYTIHTIEVLLRDTSKPLLGHLSSREGDCLESLVRIVAVLGSTTLQNKIICSHALQILDMFLKHENDGPSIFAWDSLGMLIPMTFSLPSLFSSNQSTPIPTGECLEAHVLNLIFLSHVVKILIALNLDELSILTEMDTYEENILLDVLKIMNKNREGINGHCVWEHVQNACVPFLRCCVLFYHYLTDVPAPPILQEVGGDTFSNMCLYLGLPSSPRELFSSKIVENLIVKWCQHEEVASYLKLPPPSVIREPSCINQLVRLPHDYSELINMASSFTCPNNDNEVSRNPMMCLLCGKILCSQRYCCRTDYIGACNDHAFKCSAGVGIFLRIRKCELVLLNSPHKGCLYPPPYVDNYGETDQGLRRGNPLKLCPERYKKLNNLWLNHSIRETIARSMESGGDILLNEWHNL